MIKKLLGILFILSIVLTNKAHQRLEPYYLPEIKYALCGNVPVFELNIVKRELIND